MTAGVLGRNWAGNHRYAATRLHRPGSVAELQELVAGARRLKALGTRHCFNDVADFPGGELVSPAGLPGGIDIDRSRHTATVPAATTYGELAPVLDAAGYALPNLASLPHCSVAGSVATATHGAGQRHRNLAAAVSAVELVTADGRLRRYSRAGDPDDFGGVVVALGALGVVTRLTLDLVPAFTVAQHVYEGLRWDTAVAHFDELQAAGYSVSLFTDWASEVIDQVWVKARLAGAGAGPVPAEPAGLLGARPAGGPRHPVPGASAVHCTEQLGLPGPWYDRLPHFRLGFTPSSGAELQSEYFVPRPHAAAAVEAFRSLSGLVSPLLLVSEVRAVAADEQWLSPCYRVDCVAVHLTWQPRPAEVLAALPVIEQRLAPLAVRPHWGKLFAGPLFAGPGAGYPRLPDFRRLMAELDPGGTFRSPFVTRHLLAG